MKFPGVISFLYDLPTFAIPKGSFFLVALWTFLKLTNTPCAVSGLKYTKLFESSVTPIWVLNIILNWRIGVNSVFPQLGHVKPCSLIKSFIWSVVMPLTSTSGYCLEIKSSALKRPWQYLQSIKGSLKVETCPVASHTLGFINIAESIPTLVGHSLTNFFHHNSFKLFLSSLPNGP